MHVLLIGGTGLISTAIVNQLVERGDEVTVYNRGLTPRRIPQTVKEIKGDRWDYPAFEKQMRNMRFDAVIDMMAFAPESAESVLRAFAGQVKQIVVCSTVCVYGGPLTQLPATEDEPHRPVTDYGSNKSKIESILLSANEKNGLQMTIIRPSYTTGEGSEYPGVLFDSSIPSRLKAGLPVIVMDDGKADFAIAHVSDVARAFVNSLLNPKAYGQAYHVTSDEYTTWDGIYQAMAKAVGGQFNPVHIPTDWLYDQAPRRSLGVKFMHQYPSIFNNSKAARDLDFKTTVSLTETWRRQFEWMEQSGKTKRVEEECFEDIMVEAYQKNKSPQLSADMDFNPWGNNITI